MNDLGSAPFRQRRRRGLAIVSCEAEPHGTLEPFA
jgi:hypothetical protein